MFYPVRGGALHFDFVPPDDQYDIMYRLPGNDRQRGERLLQSAIEATLDIAVNSETRLTDVYVMTADPERVASWEPGRSSLKFDSETGLTAPTNEILERMKAGEEFFFGMGGSETLADGYSFALGLPVVDESGADGLYTFCYPWDKKRSAVAETIARAEKHLGVTLTKTQREIEVLVVRRASQDATSNGP